jgi:hypothetical protein
MFRIFVKLAIINKQICKKKKEKTSTHVRVMIFQRVVKISIVVVYRGWSLQLEESLLHVPIPP